MDWSYQVGWDYFSRWVESFPDDQIDDDPSQKKSTSQLPLEASKIFNTAGDVQHPRAENKNGAVNNDRMAKVRETKAQLL